MSSDKPLIGLVRPSRAVPTRTVPVYNFGSRRIAVSRTTLHPSVAPMALYRSVPPASAADSTAGGDGAYAIMRRESLNTTPAPDQYAKKFYNIPHAKPAVVGLDSKMLPPSGGGTTVRGVPGFFPPIKLKYNQHNATAKDTHYHLRHSPRSSPVVLELVPETSPPEEEPPVTVRPIPKDTTARLEKLQSQGLYGSTVFPNIVPYHVDNLSDLPPPKMLYPKGDLPWVYRYKVKKNMNQLSKIMASRPNYKQLEGRA